MEILIYKSIIITLSIIAAFVAFKGFFCVLRMLEKNTTQSLTKKPY